MTVVVIDFDSTKIGLWGDDEGMLPQALMWLLTLLPAGDGGAVWPAVWRVLC